ncbi:MAG: putative acyl-CoA dehydrogenase, partial [Mycobacterium sp.]|nr:putative acyl-CoA dehydrogenase [Mycobacterium sp.]
MTIAITEDHRALAAVVGSFASSHALLDVSRDAFERPLDDKHWKLFTDLGWPGIHLPEHSGGAGYGLPELAVVLEGLGHSLAPGSLLASAAASAALAQAAAGSQFQVLLPRLASGEIRGALGIDGDFAVATDRLNGAGLVVGGAWADQFVLAVGNDLVVVAADSPGVRVAIQQGLDPGLGIAEVSCADVAVDSGAVIAEGRAEALRITRVLAAAESAGGARACLEMAVAYAKVREQFGRTIGSFQAVKHHLANMFVAAERATATAWDAAAAAPGDQGSLAGAVAGATSSAAYCANAEMNIQVHGGIGFTWEHPAHLYLRRARALAALWGTPDRAHDEVAAFALAGVRRRHQIALPAEAEQFRVEARAFLAEYLKTPESGRRPLMSKAGYLTPHWPKPYGRGAGPVEQLVIETELADIDTPDLGIGDWVLLTLIQHATPEQTERWIPPSLVGDLIWCQLFSEPAAGSDAAGVRTKATRVEGGWQVTGQKVWTSGAHLCNRGLVTVRTDPGAPKHKGLTTMVLDMTDPGVDVRPLREITGEALFNEVFIDDVFIPDADVVGQVNQGWTVARATLGNERVSIGTLSTDFEAFDLFPLIARHSPDDTAFIREAGALMCDDYTLAALNLRRVIRAVEGAGQGAEGNVTKLVGAEHSQQVTALALRVAGPAAI